MAVFDQLDMIIVTGSCLKAEEQDRPLAYRLQAAVRERTAEAEREFRVVVMNDLWYLNSEQLRHVPVVSIGSPEWNALSAHLLRKLPRALEVDNALSIQMDMHLEDLRASLWGVEACFTENALDIFIHKGYLDRFLEAVLAR